MPEELVTIITVFICVGLPIIAFTLIRLAKILKGDTGNPGKRRSRPTDVEEAELLQSLHQGLSKLEKRIDALETIIIERHK